MNYLERFAQQHLLAHAGAIPEIRERNGTKEWFLDGVRHRGDDLPAVEDPNMNEWWVFGKRHRNNGPAMVSEWWCEWWVCGKRHRGYDQPAVTNTVGTHCEWWVNGKRHREFGLPASIGTTTKWYHKGVEMSRDEVYKVEMQTRKTKFGTFLLLICEPTEDDLYFLVKLNWK